MLMKKLQKMSDVVVGIDIGATSSKFGIVDKKGRCLAFHSINTGQYRDFDKFLENLHKEIIRHNI